MPPKATQIALEAIQCLGGNGYINDYATGRLLRDAKLYEMGRYTGNQADAYRHQLFNEMPKPALPLN